MKIAVVSSTVLPACLPDDPNHTAFYGSEMMNAVLVKGLADAGHEIGFYAPVSSSTFKENPLIKYHPIVNSKGAHLQSELLENISYDGSKTDDLASFDFVLDMSKQNHVTEEISLYKGYNKFIHYKSGYQDWGAPMRIYPHFVTHCEYFANNFYVNGRPKPDVARFGLSDFWNNNYDSKEPKGFFPFDLEPQGYFLFPHRPVADKGIDTVLKLARAFPDETFVISTAAVFEDHIKEMARVKAEAANIPNVKFVDCPKNKRYHYYRRALMRNARAILSVFSSTSGYLDTGGLVSFEAIRCGTPVIVTRSPGSEEMLGELEDKGVVMVDGFDGARLAIKFKAYETRPNVDNTFMPIKTYVDDYLQIMKKYS
jgi:glycosyltransferase involved in cell wall biosynthesis